MFSDELAPNQSTIDSDKKNAIDPFAMTQRNLGSIHQIIIIITRDLGLSIHSFQYHISTPQTFERYQTGIQNFRLLTLM